MKLSLVIRHFEKIYLKNKVIRSYHFENLTKPPKFYISGKQTILNIIASTTINGQVVAVVPSENLATRNVFKKYENNKISCIAAFQEARNKKQE